MTGTPSPLTLLDMEERLLGDRDGQARAAIIAELEGHLAAVRRRLDAGAAVEEFRRLSLLKTALEAAGRVVPEVWRRFEGRRP
jgi:type III secretion system YseE family protein